MAIPGNLLTTAMAVMPHTDVQRALDAALSLDLPFWPQLPNYSYYEDTYVQASEHFPGICLDLNNRKLSFSTDKFIAELEETLAHFEAPDYLDVSAEYSVVYRQFLGLDLADRPAIRGQLEGPISFGFNILDEDGRPILFNDTVRPFMLEFMARRINVQLQKLKERNANVWGIVPTGVEAFEKENHQSLVSQIESVWHVLRGKGIDFDLLLSRSLLSPATCCLVNPDREKTVEKAFHQLRQISRRMREHYRIGF